MKPIQLALGLSLLVAASGAAQSRGLREVRSWGFGGGGVMVGIPVGEFRNFVDVAGGLGGVIGVNLDRRGSVGLRLTGSYLQYGHERRPVALAGTGGLLGLDLNTAFYIASLRAGPQFVFGEGPVRPYGFSSAWSLGCASVAGRSGVALGATLLHQVRAVVAERDQPPFAVRRVRERSTGEQKQVAPGDRPHVPARAVLDVVGDPLARDEIERVRDGEPVGVRHEQREVVAPGGVGADREVVGQGDVRFEQRAVGLELYPAPTTVLEARDHGVRIAAVQRHEEPAVRRVLGQVPVAGDRRVADPGGREGHGAAEQPAPDLGAVMAEHEVLPSPVDGAVDLGERVESEHDVNTALVSSRMSPRWFDSA